MSETAMKSEMKKKGTNSVVQGINRTTRQREKTSFSDTGRHYNSDLFSSMDALGYTQENKVETGHSWEHQMDREHTTPISLSDSVRSQLESRLGSVFSDVRLVQSDLPHRFNVDALTQGNLIRFAPGTFSPDTKSGEHLLAHELAHSVQQSRGEGMRGTPGEFVYDPVIEHAADTMAQQALTGGLSLRGANIPSANRAPMLGGNGTGNKEDEDKDKGNAGSSLNTDMRNRKHMTDEQELGALEQELSALEQELMQKLKSLNQGNDKKTFSKSDLSKKKHSDLAMRGLRVVGLDKKYCDSNLRSEEKTSSKSDLSKKKFSDLAMRGLRAVGLDKKYCNSNLRSDEKTEESGGSSPKQNSTLQQELDQRPWKIDMTKSTENPSVSDIQNTKNRQPNVQDRNDWLTEKVEDIKGKNSVIDLLDYFGKKVVGNSDFKVILGENNKIYKKIDEMNKSIDVEKLKNRLIAMTQMIRDFPELKKNIGNFIFKMIDSSLVMSINGKFDSSNRTDMTWNIKYIKKKDPEEQTEELKSYPFGGTHELGHIIEKMLCIDTTKSPKVVTDKSPQWRFDNSIYANDVINEALMRLYNGYDKTANKAKHPDIQEFMKAPYKSENKVNVKVPNNIAKVNLGSYINPYPNNARMNLFSINQTSHYGTKSPTEMFAEAFHDVYQNGTKARALSKKIVKVVWLKYHPEAAAYNDKIKNRNKTIS